jgi:hypothetical protein
MSSDLNNKIKFSHSSDDTTNLGELLLQKTDEASFMTVLENRYISEFYCISGLMVIKVSITSLVFIP